MLKYEQLLSNASEAPLLALRQISGFERPYALTQANPNLFKISSLSARDVEKLFALMAGYRLIDAFQVAHRDISLGDAPIHIKQAFLGDWESLASKGWEHLNDWVGLALDFSKGLATWDKVQGDQSYVANSSPLHQLKLASALLNKSNTATTLLNIHLAAMHVAHLFSTPLDSEVSLLFLLCGPIITALFSYL
jgi:hypothetical protein